MRRGLCLGWFSRRCSAIGSRVLIAVPHVSPSLFQSLVWAHAGLPQGGLGAGRGPGSDSWGPPRMALQAHCISPPLLSDPDFHGANRSRHRPGDGPAEPSQAGPATLPSTHLVSLRAPPALTALTSAALLPQGPRGLGVTSGLSTTCLLVRATGRLHWHRLSLWPFSPADSQLPEGRDWAAQPGWGAAGVGPGSVWMGFAGGSF